jgi:hypothetical protein
MRRRTLLVALAGLAVVVAAGVVVLWPRPASRITRENFDRICEGMSGPEVAAILGPPGDYRTAPTQFEVEESYRAFDEGEANSGYARCDKWTDDTACIEVEYGRLGSTASALFCVRRRDAQGPLENLVWRASRQWRRCFP